MGLRVLARCIAFTGLMALFGGALAQAPAAAPAPTPMTPEELRSVYDELLQTHDGFTYTLNMFRFTNEDAVRRQWEIIQRPPNRARSLDKSFKTVVSRTLYLYSLDPALRAPVLSLYDGERSGPVQGRDSWYIVEMIHRQASPAPAFASVEASIPAYVAAGMLPSAAQLQSDPALRQRSIANRILTVDDLRAAPGDLDVKAKLSSGDTLLNRAIQRGKPDLVEALLKRGANPNQCAGKFCPVQLAVYGGSPVVVDLLLKAGADPNQNDPSIGVHEGPLGAAAFKGDLDLMNRLIALGAKVNVQGKAQAPLIAAVAAGQRSAAELLLAKGADVFAVTDTTPQRSVLDAAESRKNAEFAGWVRGVMLAAARDSGLFAWDGWIEQDGRRRALDGKPVQLKRAPFRIIVRMKPGRTVYAAAASDPRLFEEFKAHERDGALFFNGSITFESKEANHLVVHAPGKPGERWGGSQAWSKTDDFNSFASVTDTPQGREYAREIREIVAVGVEQKGDGVPVASYAGKSIFMVLGTRIPLKFMEDDVFGGKNVELQFTQ